MNSAVPADLQAKIQAEAVGKTVHHPITLESKACNATEKNEKTNEVCKKDQAPETSAKDNTDKPVEDKELKTKKAQRTRKKDSDNKKS